MTAESRKVQLGAEFDATGVKRGTQDVKDAARDMARDVQASAQQAGQGLSGLGNGADAAGQKVDRATKSIVASIERATAAAKAGEKGSAAYFEALASQRGANLGTLQPYIDQLRQVERAQQAATASLGAMGVSAGQTRNALRQLPAQFTDIFTSLASGQAPLTVLIQQGGQIKDTFGGIVPALKGVASALSPTALAVGALVGGTVALATAYKLGSEEADEYRRQLVLTGNAAGTTAAALADVAAAVGQRVGTQGQAAAVLAQLAGTGRVAAADLDRLAEAAIRLQREGGPAVEKTVAAFAELGKAPTEGALKLNESTRFLNVGLLEQIRTLEDQGRTVEAARLAQTAYADTVLQRSRELEQGLGSLERGWRTVWDSAKGAWDAMMGIGRAQTPAQRLAEIEAELEFNRQRGLGRVNIYGNGPGENERLRQERAGLNRGLLNRSEQSATQREASLAVEDAERARKAWQQWGEAADTAAEKATKGIAKMRAAMAAENEQRARRGAPLITEEEARRAEDAIRRQSGLLKDQTTASRAAAEEERKRAALLAELSGLSTDYASDLQRLQSLRAAGVITEQRYVEQVTQLVQKQPFAVKQARDLAEAERERARVLADMERSYASYLQGIDRGLGSAERQLQALGDEYIELTQGQAARERVVQQRLDDAAALARQVANGALWSEGLTVETQKLMALADAQQAVANGRRRNTEQTAASEASKQAERAAQDAAREWAATARDIRDSLTDAFRRAFESGEDFGTAMAKVVEREIKARVATALAGSLADVLLAAAGLTAGGQAGAQAGASGALGSVNNLSTLYSTGSRAYNWLSGAYGTATGNLATSTAAYTSMANSQALAAYGVEAAGATSGGVAAGGASSGATGGLSATGWGAIVAAAVIAAMQGSADWSAGFRREQARDSGTALGEASYRTADLFARLGVSDRIADIISGATLTARAFGRAAPRVEASGVQGAITGGDFTGDSFFDIVEKGGWFRSDKRYQELAALPEELGRFLDEAAAKVLTSAKDYGAALGLPADQLAGITTDIKVALTDDADANLKAIADALAGYGDALVAAYADAVRPLAAYGETTAQTIARVGQALLGVNDVLQTIGLSALQASVQGGQAALQLQGLFGGVQGLQQAAGAYAQNFLSESERADITRAAIGRTLSGVGIDAVPASRVEFRALLEQQSKDVLTDQGQRAVAALLSVADAFASITPAAEAAAAESTRLADAVAGVTDRFLTEAQRVAVGYERASARLAGLGVSASAADLAALSGDSIAGFVADFSRLAGVSDDTKLAVVEVAEALLDLKDASLDSAAAAAESIDAIYRAASSSRPGTASQAVRALEYQLDARALEDAVRSPAAQAARQQRVDEWLSVFAPDPTTGQRSDFARGYAGMQGDRAAEAVAAVLLRDEQEARASIVSVADNIAASVAATNAAADETKRLIEGMASLRDSIVDLSTDVSVGALSALSPEQRYQSLNASVDLLGGRAVQGDREAAQQLQSLVPEFLRSSRGYFGGGAGFVDDNGKVLSILGKVAELLSTLNGNTEAGISINLQGLARVADATQGTTAAVRTQADRALLLAQRGVE